jgi:hypothetical protein
MESDNLDRFAEDSSNSSENLGGGRVWRVERRSSGIGSIGVKYQSSFRLDANLQKQRCPGVKRTQRRLSPSLFLRFRVSRTEFSTTFSLFLRSTMSGMSRLCLAALLLAALAFSSCDAKSHFWKAKRPDPSVTPQEAAKQLINALNNPYSRYLQDSSKFVRAERNPDAPKTAFRLIFPFFHYRAAFKGCHC